MEPGKVLRHADKVLKYAGVIKKVAEGMMKYYDWGLDTVSFRMLKYEVGDPDLAEWLWKLAVSCHIVYGPLKREFSWVGLTRSCSAEGFAEFVRAVEAYGAELLDLLSEVVARVAAMEDNPLFE